MDNFRERLGLIVFIISIAILAILGIAVIWVDGKEAPEVFSSILPMVGTWVGVVLAFYFGKENYEAASKRYEHLIDRLTPDVLDNVAVNQIMIAKKTMVLKTWKEVKDQTVKDVITFLLQVNKSRLPILGEDGRVKYMIHESLLSKPKMDQENQMQLLDPSTKMSAFVADPKYKSIVEQVIWVNETEILENVRRKMNDNPDCKDVFIENANNELVGWLTDTLILRYINSKKM